MFWVHEKFKTKGSFTEMQSNRWHCLCGVVHTVGAIWLPVTLKDSRSQEEGVGMDLGTGVRAFAGHKNTCFIFIPQPIGSLGPV